MHTNTFPFRRLSTAWTAVSRGLAGWQCIHLAQETTT